MAEVIETQQDEATAALLALEEARETYAAAKQKAGEALAVHLSIRDAESHARLAFEAAERRLTRAPRWPSAGRELDALVAVRVLGWRCLELASMLAWQRPDGTRDAHPPRCSTEIGLAWVAIEAMNRRGWILSRLSAWGHRPGGHDARLAKWPSDMIDTVEVEGPSAAVALCWAALAAVEAEERATPK